MLGHGTGDVRDVLVEKYTEHNLISALEHQYNAHNQFFQILISSGIIGLLLFLLSTYFGAKSNPLLLQFIVITFIFMSVESILENQAGTIFFGLFFSLLSQKSLTKV
jgi:O-antigen ligase